MKNVVCNTSSLVCYNHFRECDYKVYGERWILSPGAVPSQFDHEAERNTEIDDSIMSIDETLKNIESVERTENDSWQKNS